MQRLITYFRLPADTSTVRFLRNCLALSFVLHLVAGIWSEGFHHPDEHFQILEFANAYMGRIGFEDLEWEYPARIRPWLQPLIVAGIMKGSQQLGITSPFDWVMIARLLSALLGWVSSVFLALCCFRWFHSTRLLRWALGAATLTWFIPYQHARMSSEGWSTSLFIIGFALLILEVQARRAEPPAPIPESWWRALVVGICFGLAFQCRYQVGLMIGGAVVWCWVYGRFSLRAQTGWAVGFLAATVVGIVCDRIGYGQWVLVPERYFVINILQDKASDFGREKWYFYLRTVVQGGIGPIGAILLIGPVYSWIVKPKLSLTWVSLPFFLVHQLIAHKELRFLFPLAPLAPLQFLLAWQQRPLLRLPPWLKTALLRLTLAVNFVLLFVVSPAAPSAEIVFQRRLYHEAQGTLYVVGDNPYRLVGLKTHFYRKQALKVLSVPMEKVMERLRAGDEFWLYVPSWEDAPKETEFASRCELRFSTVPRILVRMGLGPLLRKTRVEEWTAYHCAARR